MRNSGIHEMFLDDAHWASMWSKHFERTSPTGHVESSAPSTVPFGVPVAPSIRGRNLRVLQWNLLAEGLVPEGFLMPLVSRDHVNVLDEYLADLLKSGKPEDLAKAARLSGEGHRNVVLRIDETGDQDWEEFAQMACEMVVAMKGLPKEQKQAHGVELKCQYDGEFQKKRHYINLVYEDFGEFHKHKDPRVAVDGQLSKNEKAVVSTDHRLLRVLWFVALLQPDVICFQEVDNFLFLKEELAKMGYACGMPDSPEYVPYKDRVGETYQSRVESSPWAFSPKTGGKRDASNARHFLEKRIQDGTGQKAQFLGRDDWPMDDDGQAIFWRTDRFRLVGSPEFLVLPGDTDMRQFVAGEVDHLSNEYGVSSAVRVLLELTTPGQRVDGQQFHVCTTHLTSGTDMELARILELRYLSEQWGRTGLPEIWALDANTEINFEDPSSKSYLGISIPGEANALRTFMRQTGLATIWKDAYDDSKPTDVPPVSVWKMRGSASKQPKKVGEDMYQLIDHIFYNGRGLFNCGQQALRLRERLQGPNVDRDWLALIPNELVPSDHLPIVWDFEVQSCPRREALVLLGQAHFLWRKLLGTMGGEMDGGVMADMQTLLYLTPESTTSTEDVAVAVDSPSNCARPSLTAATSRNFARPVLPETPQQFLTWIEELTSEARSVLGSKLDISDRLRADCIERKGKRSSEDFLCCILSAHIFAVGSVLLADMPPKPVGGGLWTSGLCAPTLVGAVEILSLAALRNIGRAQILAWKRRESDRFSAGLFGLAAQMLENLYGGPSRCRCPRMVEAFDYHGKLSSAELDALLTEVQQELESNIANKAPPCLALRSVDWQSCGAGHQVWRAVRMILNMVEAGGVEFHEKSVDINPTWASLPLSPATAHGNGASAVAMIKNNTLLEQSFDESIVVSAFSGLARSGNFDSGGGLALLLDALAHQLNIIERWLAGRGQPDREARALNRPDPISLAAFIRRAAISACEEVWPITVLMVATQKLEARMAQSHNGARPNRCPAYDLVQALRHFPGRESRSQIFTLRRILRILVALCKDVGADSMLPPVVHGSGLARFKDLLDALQELGQEDQLRWQTLASLTHLLDLLLNSSEPGGTVASALAGKVRAAVEQPLFRALFLQRPALELDSLSYDMKQVLENIDNFMLVKQLSAQPCHV